MRAIPLEIGTGAGGSMIPQVAVVMIVLILGASLYLWRMRYLRSRAALITLLAIILALAALAMSGG